MVDDSCILGGDRAVTESVRIASIGRKKMIRTFVRELSRTRGKYRNAHIINVMKAELRIRRAANSVICRPGLGTANIVPYVVHPKRPLRINSCSR